MSDKDEALKLAREALKRVRAQDMELVQLSMLASSAIDEALAEQPAQRTWVGLTHEDTYEATGTASTDLLDLAKLWSDNKVHVYQFDNEARKIIEAVLRRASAKLREKNA